MACTAAPRLVLAAEALDEANQKIVLAFYDAAFVKFDADAARGFLGLRHVQHNP